MESTVKNQKLPLVDNEKSPDDAMAWNDDMDEDGGSSEILKNKVYKGKILHTDFYNNFSDMFDEDNESAAQNGPKTDEPCTNPQSHIVTL